MEHNPFYFTTVIPVYARNPIMAGVAVLQMIPNTWAVVLLTSRALEPGLPQRTSALSLAFDAAGAHGTALLCSHDSKRIDACDSYTGWQCSGSLPELP